LKVTIELPNLPYAHDALEPLISGATLKVHYGKHHGGYVDKLNALLQGTDLADTTLETIVHRAAWCRPTDPVMVAVFNNAAQAWNHAFYWKSLRPKGGRAPQGVLASRIAKDFGGHDGLAREFKLAAASHFGSGWAWLVLDGGTLKVSATSNADTPMIRGQSPLLVIDIWEHAYYLDYQERRSAYVAAVVDHLLDWEFAERNFERSKGAQGDEVIYVSGQCLGTAEIERVLVAHPAVIEAAVVGYPHPVKGQGTYAYVTLKSGARGSDALRQDLARWVRTKIAPIAVPDVIQWAPALPRTRVGMLARQVLRGIAANDSSGLGDTSALADATVVDDLIRSRSDVAETVR
jgi:Fe-Mn family superoxide dismutase